MAAAKTRRVSTKGQPVGASSAITRLSLQFLHTTSNQQLVWPQWHQVARPVDPASFTRIHHSHHTSVSFSNLGRAWRVYRLHSTSSQPWPLCRLLEANTVVGVLLGQWNLGPNTRRPPYIMYLSDALFRGPGLRPPAQWRGAEPATPRTFQPPTRAPIPGQCSRSTCIMRPPETRRHVPVGVPSSSNSSSSSNNNNNSSRETRRTVVAMFAVHVVMRQLYQLLLILSISPSGAHTTVSRVIAGVQVKMVPGSSGIMKICWDCSRCSCWGGWPYGKV